MTTESAPTSFYTMLEFIDELKTKFEIDGEFDFSILVEKSPIKKPYTYCCKVLAIIISGRKTITYDQIVEKDLQYLEVRETIRRKVGTRNNPFFIDGHSKIQTYKDNDFIEYSFRNASKKDLAIVEKMRAKFNIAAPHEFRGKSLHLNDDVLFDEI